MRTARRALACCVARSVAWSVACGALACGASQVGVPPPPLQATPVAPVADAAPEPHADGPHPLSAVLLGQLPEGTFGPYVGAHHDGRALALWAALDERGQRRWYSLLVDAKGTPLSPARALTDAPADLTLAKLVGTPSGFLALVARGSGSSGRIEALSLKDTGELAAGPVLLEQSRGDVVWIEALGGGAQPLAAWASVSDSVAALHVSSVDLQGKPGAQRQRVAGAARAWQAVQFSDGVALGAVLGGAEGGDLLRVSFLGADASSIGQAEVVSGKRLAAELDLTRVGDRLLVAWVEQEAGERRLSLAALSADGKRVAGPEQVSGLGNQRLWGFVPASERGDDPLLVWEEEGQAPRGERRFRIARVSRDAKLEARRAELSLVGDERERPELVRKGNSLALLTRALACPREGECAAREPVPMYAELGQELELLAAEPLRLEPVQGEPADLAWGLHCNAESCSALAALPAAPVPVYSVELRPRSRSWEPPVRVLEDAAPRALDLRSVGDTDPLADVAAAPGAEGWLLATLTQFDESTPYVKRKTAAPDGRYGPLRAQITVRSLPRGGKVLGPAQVISYRARAPGGIALAGSSDGRGLLLWTALDKMRPEVFATLLRPGKGPQQRMLTQAAGQVSQLAAAVLPQGFMAAWISDPNGDAQVWGVRLGADLAPLAPPAPLTRGPGAAVGLSLARRGDTAWLAWVQGGDHEQRLLASRLDAKTGAPSGEVRVLRRSEAGTLVSPVLVGRAQGALLAWIERPVVGNGGGRAWLLELDAELQPRGEPRAVQSPSGDARAVRLSCEGERCIGGVDGRPANGALLEGFAWEPPPSPGATSAEGLVARELVWRASPSSDPAAFALAGEHVFYGDRREQRGLLRRVGVEWP
ncbi:MAG: hypothetical protein RL033_4487 [Pseudomonadota bacterium]